MRRRRRLRPIEPPATELPIQPRPNPLTPAASEPILMTVRPAEQRPEFCGPVTWTAVAPPGLWPAEPSDRAQKVPRDVPHGGETGANPTLGI
jgi:hypothetical protein